jgi:hypothetical protein
LEQATAKGSILTATLEFIERDLTAAQRDQVLGAVDPDRALTARGKILPTSRVPIDFLNRLIVAAAKAKGEPVETFARRAGHYAADSNLKGIYRMFARLISPDTSVSRIAALWPSIYDRGRMEATRGPGNQSTIKVLDFKLERATCERIQGWLECIAEIGGRPNPRVEQTHCCSRGEDHCEWHMTWQ